MQTALQSGRTERLRCARNEAVRQLLSERDRDGVWIGELSTSALSTATAVLALATDARTAPGPRATSERLVRRGLEWLASKQNDDGGWGDTILSLSNISTTALCWAAFGAVAYGDAAFPSTVARAEAWLRSASGENLRDALPDAIAERYGEDRTFSVPILMACALGNRFEKGSEGWKRVMPLPFELAVLPANVWGAIKLPVVSYALPALISIGQGREHHAPTRNPLTSLTRRLARQRTLDKLAAIQPENGGFLEAIPLTSFVSMSLASMELSDNIVLRRGLDFIENSVRPDGSWPIDTNLSTWVTTLSVNALEPLSAEDATDIRQWLLGQQTARVHPYTNAQPGGWGWTPLPGGVPDADDTAGALLALRKLTRGAEGLAGAEAGIKWLLGLQNRDGGIPTFCRGWGALPFDRSSPDLTAHAMRAWRAWRSELSSGLRRRVENALWRGLAYLARSQNSDGSWTPLWFGNQHAPNEENRTYGTSRALLALAEDDSSASRTLRQRGGAWLLETQQDDGSWSGFGQGSPSVEETALAVEALAAVEDVADERWLAAVERGGEWLVRAVESGAWVRPSPIGFYFAKLWYYEKLYPQIQTVAALNRLFALSERR